ncbi:NineTeen Complex (NTC) component [Hypoxylon texense]
MCWPYTLTYGCVDCFAEGRSPAEACVLVAPDAEDPVAGGYNWEGALCPLRYVGPQQDGRRVTPTSCPSFQGASFHGPVDASTANGSLAGSPGAGYGTNPYAYGSPQLLRYWICPLHRPKYIHLGPSFAGYDIARRAESVEAQKKARDGEAARGGQEQERWNELSNVVSGPQPHMIQKRKREEVEVKGGEADVTANIAAAACSLLEMADSGRYRKQKRRRNYTAGPGIP